MSSTGPMSDQAWAMKLEAEVRELRADRTALMDAAVTYMATIDRLRAALERIREIIGDGAPDIIVANTLLGRIDQLAREALKEDGA